MDNLNKLYAKFFFPIEWHILINTNKMLENRLEQIIETRSEQKKPAKGAPKKPAELKKPVLRALLINQINRQDRMVDNILQPSSKDIRCKIQVNGTIEGSKILQVTDENALAIYNDYFYRSFGTALHDSFLYIEKHVNLKAYSKADYQKKYKRELQEFTDKELDEQIKIKNEKRKEELLRSISKGRRDIRKYKIFLSTPPPFY
ncbi:hypothetical protein [Hellea balneolensis]|uniref:hypothetical protein n=1 Tax=Hellea balneolensis TaxID=287478 RepID=UPI0004788E91|nr:hypothetical protein [Hellea balneolensis]